MNPDLIKLPQTPTKPSTEPTSWPAHKHRVFYKKYINQVNQALQSLITAGRIKRMQLMSINNRALFNRGKVQRCQWTTKRKRGPSCENFQPDQQSISLDTRSPESKARLKKRLLTEGRLQTTQRQTERNSDKILDMLIEKQITKIKNENLLSSQNHDQIIRQACRSIQQKIIQSQNIRKQEVPSFSIKSSKTHHYRYMLARKDHRRSVTESAYSQELGELERKNNAFMKFKELDKKSFLRKIKHLPSSTK